MIPSHPSVLLKRTVLCNCGIEAENNFLLESIAACPGKQSALTMYYTVNMAFMYYFDRKFRHSNLPKLDKQEQVFPISLQTSEFDSKLLKVPKTHLQTRLYTWTLFRYKMSYHPNLDQENHCLTGHLLG